MKERDKKRDKRIVATAIALSSTRSTRKKIKKGIVELVFLHFGACENGDCEKILEIPVLIRIFTFAWRQHIS